MSDMITDAYEAYCAGQTSNVHPQETILLIRRLVSALRMEFPSRLDEYDALTDRLLSIWKRSVGRTDPQDFEYFRTSGTTRGKQRTYKLGPNSQLWVWAMWQLMRYPFEWRVVVKLNVDWNADQPPTVTPHTEGLYQYVITCGILNSARLPIVLEILRKVLNQYPGVSLLSVPDSFLYLNRQPEFQRLVIANKSRFNLMSWMWEPFYARHWLREQGGHLSDAMIDWATGLNFFTCGAGEQHICPIFARDGTRMVNLLNLMPPPDDWGTEEEDGFEPLGVARCMCGRHRLQYHFVPHQSVAIRTSSGQLIYDPDLAERLKTSFQSLQFLQHDRALKIYYQAEGELLDRSLLEQYFTHKGFLVQWRPNETYSIVGPKRLVFLRQQADGLPS